jgi:hypothetical protein
MKKITNPLLTLLFAFMLSVGYAQTKKPTPGTKPYTPPTTKPATTTPAKAPATTPAKVTTPPKPAPTPTATEQQDMQEQYDKLNGNAAKPAPAAPSKAKTTEKPYTRGSSATRVAETPKAKPAKEPRKASSSGDDSFFSIGARGGVNLMTVAESGKFQTEGLSNLLGYHGGLVMNIGGKVFSVQPEILFSQTGARIDILEAEATLNTVTVPLLLKLSFGGEAFRLFFTGGGFGSYMIGGKIKATQTIAGVKTTSTEAITFADGDRRIEYGVTGGAGVQIGLGKLKLNLEGRYNYGLGGNEKTPGLNPDYSRTIMASVGVLIPL